MTDKRKTKTIEAVLKRVPRHSERPRLVIGGAASIPAMAVATELVIYVGGQASHNFVEITLQGSIN